MNSSPVIFVTGASGFIGSALVARILSKGMMPRAAIRCTSSPFPSGIQLVRGVDMGSNFDWRPAIDGCDSVVHTAARVHVMHDLAADPLGEFRRVNVEGTLALAKQAADAGVRRFIFLSSVKVNGEETKAGRSFTADSASRPSDAYALSKLEAESGLKKISATSAMEVVIIRPPLVYGPGVKANFLAMMQCIYKRIPLPFGAIATNKRSLVALENLVDLIITCLDHPSASNQTFLVSDGQDLSTTELLMRLGNALGRPARLIAVPPPLLMFGGRLIGRQDMVRRLLHSLQLDIEKTRNLLGWEPPLSVDLGLGKTARHFLEQVGK